MFSDSAMQEERRFVLSLQVSFLWYTARHLQRVQPFAESEKAMLSPMDRAGSTAAVQRSQLELLFRRR